MTNFYEGAVNHYELDESAAHMIRDNNKCILCRRCVAVCEKTQGIGVIGPNNRGFATMIGSAFEMGLGETSCVSCGQCIAVCPTGALYEKDYTRQIIDAIADPEKYVVVQTAPSVRAGLGEEFGYPMGTDVEGKMAAALRRSIRQGIRYRLGGGPYHYGRGDRAFGPHQERRRTADDHLLFTGMDQIL